MVYWWRWFWNDCSPFTAHQSNSLQFKTLMERLDHDGAGKLDFDKFEKFIKPLKSKK